MPLMPCFEAVFAPRPGVPPISAATEAVFTIEPPPLSSIAGISARMLSQQPLKLGLDARALVRPCGDGPRVSIRAEARHTGGCDTTGVPVFC